MYDKTPCSCDRCPEAGRSTGGFYLAWKSAQATLPVLGIKVLRRVGVVERGGRQRHPPGVQQGLDVLVQQGTPVGSRVLELGVAGGLRPGAGGWSQEDGVQAPLVQHGQVGGVSQAVQNVQHEGAVRQLRVACWTAGQSQAVGGSRACRAAARAFPRVTVLACGVVPCLTVH